MNNPQIPVANKPENPRKMYPVLAFGFAIASFLMNILVLWLLKYFKVIESADLGLAGLAILPIMFVASFIILPILYFFGLSFYVKNDKGRLVVLIIVLTALIGFFNGMLFYDKYDSSGPFIDPCKLYKC